MKYILFALVDLFAFNAHASDKELALRVLQTAITTVVMEKCSTIPVGNNTVLGITQVFPTPQGTWKVMQEGQIGKQVELIVIRSTQVQYTERGGRSVTQVGEGCRPSVSP